MSLETLEMQAEDEKRPVRGDSASLCFSPNKLIKLTLPYTFPSVSAVN